MRTLGGSTEAIEKVKLALLASRLSVLQPMSLPAPLKFNTNMLTQLVRGDLQGLMVNLNGATSVSLPQCADSYTLRIATMRRLFYSQELMSKRVLSGFERAASEQELTFEPGQRGTGGAGSAIQKKRQAHRKLDPETTGASKCAELDAISTPGWTHVVYTKISGKHIIEFRHPTMTSRAFSFKKAKIIALAAAHNPMP